MPSATMSASSTLPSRERHEHVRRGEVPGTGERAAPFPFPVSNQGQCLMAFQMCRDKEPRSSRRTGLSLRKLVEETCASTGCLRRRSTAHPHQRSSLGASYRIGNTEPGSRMDESFSPVIFIYGLAFILGVGKACTLLIWRTLPKPRAGLRQEVREAWQRRTQRTSPGKAPEHPPGGPDNQPSTLSPTSQAGLSRP
jgi:hypothetical protein